MRFRMSAFIACSAFYVYFMPIHHSRPKFNVDFENRCLEAVSVIGHVEKRHNDVIVDEI